MPQTFSVRSNAIRNARSKLGKSAKQGVHFAVGGDKTVGFNWSPIADAPAVEDAKIENMEAEANMERMMQTEKPARPKRKAAKKAKAKVTKAIKKYLGKRVKGAEDVSGKRRILINMITGSKGASLAAICKRLGWQKHTVRGAISTAKDQGIIKSLKSTKSPHVGRHYKATKVAA